MQYVASAPAVSAVRRRSRRPWRAVALPAAVAAAVALPFALLLRGSTSLYLSGRAPTWLALAGGALLALLAVALPAAWAMWRLTGRARFRAVVKLVALPAVVAYCVHALLFLSQVNAKTEEVRSYYRTLHPLLRLGVGTLALLDGDLVVTDARRTPEDYGAMGLPAADWSMHYPQADGYVHAMDLRTLGRSGVRNWLTGVYFKVLGFQVLRHVGTADHLHITLPLPGPRDGRR